MKKWTTKNGYEIVRILSGRSNSYLISTNTTRILVDTGYESSFRKVNRAICNPDTGVTGLSYLLLTHTHFDHCRNASRIKEQEHCKIIMGQGEKDYVEKGYTPLPEGTLPLTRLLTGLGRVFGARMFGYRKFTPDMTVDGELDLRTQGLNITLLSTPGHSAGSISIIVDDEIALVGDTLFGIFQKSVFPPFADDIPGMIHSWKKLLGTPCRIFFPGHGREIPRERLQREYDRYSRKYGIE